MFFFRDVSQKQLTFNKYLQCYIINNYSDIQIKLESLAGPDEISFCYADFGKKMCILLFIVCLFVQQNDKLIFTKYFT